jgi:hypothetical protein
MRQEGHVACMGILRMLTNLYLENLRRKYHLEDGRIILKGALTGKCEMY